MRRLKDKKFTHVLQIAYEYLKSVKEVSKIEGGYTGTPHEFTGINETIKLDRLKWRIEKPTWESRINRQSLNKLISLGYAEYTNKEKTAAKFIDKDQLQSELERFAEIGRYTEMAFKKGYEMLIDDLYFIKHIETLIEWGREQSEADNE